MTPLLQHDNITVRAFIPKDLTIFAEYRANPAIAQYQSWTDYTLKDAENLYENTDYEQFGTPGNWFQLAIAKRCSNQLLGDLAVHFIDKEQVEVGFTLAPENQHNGIATQAMQLLLDYLFSACNKHRVIAVTDARNAASVKLLERLGFRREAHFVQNIYFKGEWGDEYQYALLKDEFSAQSKASIA